MKRVRIYEHQIGLVFRKGNFRKALTVGNYFVRLRDIVRIYDMTQVFHAPCELNILLQDPRLANLLEVIEVKDHEIALVYKEGNFERILKPGRHPFWKSIVSYDFNILNINELELPASIDKKLVQRKDIQEFVRVFAVESYQEGLLIIDGKLERKLGPGLYYFWKNDKAVAVFNADLRQQQLEISGQEILTKDKAAIRVNFFVQYKIVDAVKALVDNKEYAKQLYIVIQLAIREYVGTLTLDELLAKKETIKDFVLNEVEEKAAALGTALASCGIRDIILPGEVKEIMNQVLIAEKKAQANTITRREETASTRSLLNTAKLMEDNEMLLKLKEMEYVEKIADKINSISLSGGSQVVDQLKQIFLDK